MKTGAVAAGHQKTAEIGMEILKAGGNATDALIASYVASFVSEPCMGSPGGGAFALIGRQSEAPVLFDFFCQTPGVKKEAASYDFKPYTVHFGDEEEVFYFGKGSSAVPGAIAGIFALHRHSGTIPIKELFQPGIQMMKRGVELNGFQQYDIELLKGIIGNSPTGKKVLLNSSGQPKSVGEKIELAGMADFMEVIAIEGPREFYEGYFAGIHQEQYENNGGSLSASDFKNYEVLLRSPLKFPLGDKIVFCNPIPAVGGVVMAAALEKLWPDDYLFPQAGSQDYFNLFYNSFSQARKIHRDPNLAKEWLNTQMNKKWGSTSHISIIDQWGNTAALTTTIGEGNGYFDPLSQTHMNNMLGESALLPGGFHSWKPNTRLSSMMNPTMVLGSDGEKLVLGTGGAGRIPYALAQTLYLLFAGQKSLKESIEYPRLHIDDRYFHIEHALRQGKPDPAPHPLKLWKNFSLFFGGVHGVFINSKGQLEAVGDFRREGVGISHS